MNNFNKALIRWQIPTRNKGGGGDNYIHHWARPHAYIYCNNTNKSLCGKYTYEEYMDCVNTNLENSVFYLKPCREQFCNKCLEVLKRKFGVDYD